MFSALESLLLLSSLLFKPDRRNRPGDNVALRGLVEEVVGPLPAGEDDVTDAFVFNRGRDEAIFEVEDTVQGDGCWRRVGRAQS